MRKVVFINEDRLPLLAEGISSKVYHFTSLSNGYDICKMNALMLGSTFAKDAEKPNGDRTFYLSTTRIRNGNFGYSKKFNLGGVRLELDGDKLMQRYKGGQVNYWGGGLNDKFYFMRTAETNRENPRFDPSYLSKFKHEHPNATEDEINRYMSRNFDSTTQTHYGNESEDRIYSKTPSIENVDKYVLSVDVLINGVLGSSDKLMNAHAFINTKLGKKVRIYDNPNDFNSPHGKDVNEQVVEHFKGKYDEYERMMKTNYGNVQDNFHTDRLLSSVMAFILFSPTDKSANEIGAEASRLLKEYGLERYLPRMGEIVKRVKNMVSLQTVAEELDSERRNLDAKNEDAHKISKMLSDHLLSIGARSFIQGVRIKLKRLEDAVSSPSNGLDVFAKHPFIVSPQTYAISIDPSRDLFKELVRMSDDSITAFADNLSSEMEYYGNLRGSKNRTSMFHFLRKLLMKGTVEEVRATLKHKLGLDEDTLRSWSIYTEVRDLDYYEATKYFTINGMKASEKDYSRGQKITDKEVAEYIKRIS